MVIGPNNVVILLPFTSDSTDGVTIAKKNIISVENYHTPVTSDILRESWILVALPKIVWLTLQNILQQNPNETRALRYVEFRMHSGDYMSLSRKSRERILKRKSTFASGLRATSWNPIHAHGLLCFYLVIIPQGYCKFLVLVEPCLALAKKKEYLCPTERWSEWLLHLLTEPKM